MRTYTIQLDEEQCKMIVSALELMHATPNCPDVPGETTDMPVRGTLIDMFHGLRDLPENEIDHHVVHGFCL